MAENRTKIILEAVDKTRPAFDSAKSGLQGVGTAATAASRILASFGVGLSVGWLATLIKSSIDAADSLGNLAQKTGSTVEQLAGFKFAAEASGTSLESIARGANSLAKELTATPEKFRAIGITTKDTTEAMIQLADLFAGLPDGAEKTTLAMELFGKAVGPDLIPLLNEGSAGLRKLVEGGQRLNPVTAEMAKQADEFNDSLAILKGSVGELGVALVRDALPILSEVTKSMADARKGGSDFSDEMAFTADVVGSVVAVFKLLGTTVAASAAHLSAFFKGDFAGASEISKAYQEELDVILSSTSRFRDALAKQRAEINGTAINNTNSLNPDARQQALSLLKRGGGDGNLEKEIDSLRREAFLIEERSREEQVLFDIEQGRYGKLLPAQQESLLNQAREVDFQKALKESREDLIKADEEANSAAIAGKQLLIGLEKDFRVEIEKRKLALNAPLLSSAEQDLAESLLEITARAQAARAAVEKMHVAGSISGATYAQRLEEISDAEQVQKQAVTELVAEQERLNSTFSHGAKSALREYLNDVGNVAEQSKNLFKDAFRGMEDALVDFVKTGKLDFKSLADSIITDLIRIQIQQSITKPLAAAAASFFGFADGGIMSASGPLQLKKYATGGIATGPQLALFGEGRMNEAFVPLPDGRSIPVTMRGGGEVINVYQTINIQAGVSQTVRAEMMALLPRFKQEAIAGVIESKRRGGRTGSAFD